LQQYGALYVGNRERGEQGTSGLRSALLEHKNNFGVEDKLLVIFYSGR
jgi:hypothetical protein